MFNLIFNLQQKRTLTCLPSRKNTNLLYQRKNVQEQVSQPKALQQSAAVKLLRRPIHCPSPPNIASGRFCFRKRKKFFRNAVFFTPNHSVCAIFQADHAIFRSARTSCTTFGWSRPVRPALKIWITYIQAYMPYES